MLHKRADDLLERLLISELEMRRSRTIPQKVEAFHEFGRVVDCVDALRRDAEMLHVQDKDEMFDRLDGIIARVMRSAPYRTVEWIATAPLSWFIDSSLVPQAC